MVKKSFYLYVAKMAGYGLRLVLPAILVRLLTKADFGEYRQFFLIEVTIVTLFQLGVNQALYYFIPRDEENSGAYFLNSLIMNAIIFATVFGVIRIFSEQFSRALNMPLFVDHFEQLLLYTVSLMFLAAANAYLTSRQFIRQSAIFQIVNQVNTSIVTIAAALIYGTLNAIFWSLVLSSAFNVLVMLTYIHLRMRGFQAKRYFFGLWEQIKYGLLLGAGGSLWVFQARIHELFVSRYYGQEIFAVYSAGCTQIPVVDYYLQSVAVVSLGRFALMEKEGDWEGITKLWREILTSLFGIAIPGILVLLIVSKPLILTMFTTDYADAVPIFQINTLVKISMLWNAQLVLRGMNRNDVVLYVSLAVMALTPFVLYAGMLAGGMVGIIFAQLFLMLLARLGLQFVHNRISAHSLPYTVSLAEMKDFYRDGYRKARRVLSKRRASHGA